MSTPDDSAGHGTEERTQPATKAPQSAHEKTTGEAPLSGPGTDATSLDENQPEEELAVGEQSTAATGDEPAPAEPPD